MSESSEKKDLKIKDLPAEETLTPEEKERQAGAGRQIFRPTFDNLEARELMAHRKDRGHPDAPPAMATDGKGEYRAALVEYFSARKSDLSEDSRRRLDTNPLRILDSKDPGDTRLNAEAPAFGKYLNAVSREFFAQVKAGLEPQ